MGIPFYPKCFPLPQSFYNLQLEKLQQTIATWQKRKISFIGKVHVLNSRLLSKIWYLSYFISFPPYFFKILNKLLSTFIWDRHFSQISLSNFFTPIQHGGLGLLDPKLQVTAIKGWWIQQMTQPLQLPWFNLAISNFTQRYSP